LPNVREVIFVCGTFWYEILKGRNYFEDFGLGGRMIIEVSPKEIRDSKLL
jgi:hypothetical protein